MSHTAALRPTHRTTALRTLAAACLSLLAGCGALPTAGPSNSQVVDDLQDPKLNPLGIHLVDLTPATVQTLRSRPERPMSVFDGLGANRPIDLLGPGDALAITVYETGEGLFTPKRPSGVDDSQPVPGSTAEALPRVVVDRNGFITVPYAGQIRVSGHTTTDVQKIIQDRLAAQASQPQVVVTLASNGSNVVYVSGDIHNSGRYSLTLAHERLLDMIALAGGPSHSPQDTLVKVNRGGREATTSLTRIQTNADENIAVEPQDRIQVDYLPRSFLSFGATGRVAQIPFDAATVSLAEAIGRVGGLDDSRANPEAVFLFRYERPAVAELLGIIPSTPIQTVSAPVMPGSVPEGIPVVYRLNMRAPGTFFSIEQFPMQDKDLIYIANAPTVQIYKFLSLIYTVVTPAVTARQLSP